MCVWFQPLIFFYRKCTLTNLCIILQIHTKLLSLHYCKKERLFWLNLVITVSYIFCIIKFSGVPLPALHSNNSLNLAVGISSLIRWKAIALLDVFISDVTARNIFIHIWWCCIMFLWYATVWSSISSINLYSFCKYRYTVAYIKLYSLWYCTSTNSYCWVTAAISHCWW